MLPQGRVSWGPAASLPRGSAVPPSSSLQGLLRRMAVRSCWGSWGRVWVPYLRAHVYSVTCMYPASISLSLPHFLPPLLTLLIFSAEFAWGRSPAVAAAALPPPGSLGPALCTHPRVSGVGRMRCRGWDVLGAGVTVLSSPPGVEAGSCALGP